MTAEDSPAQDRSTAEAGRGPAEPGLEPDQGLTRQLLLGSRAVASRSASR